MGGRATDLTNPRSRRLLLPLVFISGMASLAVEFGAARLLAPYFGTSLYVWGVLIGLVLVYLSVGYVIGGRLADAGIDSHLQTKVGDNHARIVLALRTALARSDAHDLRKIEDEDFSVPHLSGLS